MNIFIYICIAYYSNLCLIAESILNSPVRKCIHSSIGLSNKPPPIGAIYRDVKYNISTKIGVGVYIIKSLIDSRVYVGSTKGLYKRFCDHKSYLISKKHNNRYLQAFVDKYGIESLVFELLEYCELDNLLEREQYYFDTIKPFPSTSGGFNLSTIAKGGMVKHTEESKAKMSKQRRGVKRKPLSENWKKAISESNKKSESCRKQLEKMWESQKKDYVFLNPKGETIEIRYLKDFCDKNNLSDSKMVAVYKGRRISHKGWKIINGKESKKPSHYKTVYQFSIDGRLVKEYSSIGKASKAVGTTNANGIIECANGDKCIFKGFVWSFSPSFPESRKDMMVEKFGFKIGDIAYIDSKKIYGMVGGFTKNNLVKMDTGKTTVTITPKDLI